MSLKEQRRILAAPYILTTVPLLLKDGRSKLVSKINNDGNINIITVLKVYCIETCKVKLCRNPKKYS